VRLVAYDNKYVSRTSEWSTRRKRSHDEITF